MLNTTTDGSLTPLDQSYCPPSSAPIYIVYVWGSGLTPLNLNGLVNIAMNPRDRSCIREPPLEGRVRVIACGVGRPGFGVRCNKVWLSIALCVCRPVFWILWTRQNPSKWRCVSFWFIVEGFKWDNQPTRRHMLSKYTYSPIFIHFRRVKHVGKWRQTGSHTLIQWTPRSPGP